MAFFLHEVVPQRQPGAKQKSLCQPFGALPVTIVQLAPSPPSFAPMEELLLSPSRVAFLAKAFQ